MISCCCRRFAAEAVNLLTARQESGRIGKSRHTTLIFIRDKAPCRYFAFTVLPGKISI